MWRKGGACDGGIQVTYKSRWKPVRWKLVMRKSLATRECSVLNVVIALYTVISAPLLFIIHFLCMPIKANRMNKACQVDIPAVASIKRKILPMSSIKYFFMNCVMDESKTLSPKTRPPNSTGQPATPEKWSQTEWTTDHETWTIR